MSNLLLGIIALSLGVAVAIPMLLLFESSKRRVKETGDSFQRWVTQAEKNIPSQFKVSKHWQLFGLTVFLLGCWLFNSPLPAFFGALLIVLIPNQLLHRHQQKHRDMVLEQLSSAVRIFAAEFAVTPQIERGLAAVGRRIPDPVGKIFRRTHSQLTYGANSDEVFAKMIREFNSPYGHMFVQLLRTAQKQGRVVAPLFHDLVSRITVAQELSQYNKGELSGERHIGLLLTIAPLPLYFTLQYYLPEAREFFQTGAGQTIVTLSFLSAIGWFFVDRMVSEA